MGSSSGSFTGNGGEIRLSGEPCHHRGPGIRLAVKIDMDERRTHDAADVVVGAIAKILREEVGGDLRGGVAAPAFEERLFPTLVVVAPVWRKERVNRPAERASIKLNGG